MLLKILGSSKWYILIWLPYRSQAQLQLCLGMKVGQWHIYYIGLVKECHPAMDSCINICDFRKWRTNPDLKMTVSKIWFNQQVGNMLVEEKVLINTVALRARLCQTLATRLGTRRNSIFFFSSKKYMASTYLCSWCVVEWEARKPNCMLGSTLLE